MGKFIDKLLMLAEDDYEEEYDDEEYDEEDEFDEEYDEVERETRNIEGEDYENGEYEEDEYLDRDDEEDAYEDDSEETYVDSEDSDDSEDYADGEENDDSEEAYEGTDDSEEAYTDGEYEQEDYTDESEEGNDNKEYDESISADESDIEDTESETAKNPEEEYAEEEPEEKRNRKEKPVKQQYNNPDDYEEYDDDEYEETPEERREFRRKRRIRNQILAYTFVLILLAALIGAGFVGVKKLSTISKQKKQEAEIEKQKEEEEKEQAAEIVVDTPETLEEEPEQEEVEEVDYLAEVVEAYISEMPIEDKVAGLFVITPEALTGVNAATKAGGGTQEALTNEAVGGLVYSKKNIVDKDQLTEMLANTVNMSKYPLFLAIAEEGGENAVIANSSIEVDKTEDMATIGENGDAGKAYESGLTIGGYMKALGFNLNLAPVSEVAVEGENDLGKRVFGTDGSKVGEMASNLARGLEDGGVSSCLKYFPVSGKAGDGNGRAEITKTIDELRECELVAFKQGIEAGADFVMLSNVNASAIDKNGLPCSLSREIVTDILRDELGYKGVVITGALNDSAIKEYYTSGEAAVLALAAGADMMLMPDDYKAAKEAILAAVQEGTISEERINESLRRIYTIKCADKLE